MAAILFQHLLVYSHPAVYIMIETTATGVHALDNPWQESYVASSRGEAEYERGQAPCPRDLQLLAATQV